MLSTGVKVIASVEAIGAGTMRIDMHLDRVIGVFARNRARQNEANWLTTVDLVAHMFKDGLGNQPAVGILTSRVDEPHMHPCVVGQHDIVGKGDRSGNGALWHDSRAAKMKNENDCLTQTPFTEG